jgi:Ca2+-binding RTX toxin-like protein
VSLHVGLRRSAVALGAALATTAVLPGAAQAALTATVSGNVATFVSDGASDNLVIGEAGGLLTHNASDAAFVSVNDFDSTVAGAQTLNADNTNEIDFTGNGGEDTVLFTTVQVLRGDLDGGPGDDTIAGTDGADVLTGNADDDRLVGGPGADDMDGGAGNDTLVWNNGDGSDTMDGDAGGGDTVEVNGNPRTGDQFRVQPGPAGRVDFDRISAGPFSLDIATTERLDVNGLGGDDDIQGAAGLAPLILLDLDGGPGADAIVGGDGPDLLQGGDDVDTLSGGAGNDRLVGDRGNDTMSGNDGDDTMVWNNGDGTDGMAGGAGVDRAEVNGAPLAGETFTLGPAAGGGARFDRTAPGPFGLDITTSEQLELNALGGDDVATVANGTPLAVSIDGGPGNDTLIGGDGADLLLGGSGADALTGGGGRDLLDGQADADALFLRDGGTEDLGRCGDGADTAQADALGVDAVDGCEVVDRIASPVPPPLPLPPGVAAGDVRAFPAVIGTRAAALARNRRSFVLEVSCPAAEAGGCRVAITVTTARSVRLGGIRAVVVLATARTTLAPGQTRRLRIRVPGAVGRLFGRRSTLAVRAVAQTTDAVGNVAQASRQVTLRLPRRR